MSNKHAKALAASVLLTGSFAALVTPSAATSDPTITPGPNFELFRKQNNDQYMGWVSYSGSWTSAECEAGATYYQSGGHWRCCGTTSAGCEIPQACVNGNLIYNGAVIGASTSVTLAWYITLRCIRCLVFEYLQHIARTYIPTQQTPASPSATLPSCTRTAKIQALKQT